MRDDLRETVGAVFCDVMEKMAFMFGDAIPKEELQPLSSKLYQASMGFGGDMEGSLSLTVPVEMCEEISANILGLDPGDEMVVTQALDAFKEILNVTCGNILTEVAGTTPVFNLSVPQVSELDKAGYEALLNDPDTLSFIVDDNLVLLRFEIKSEGK